VIERTKLGAYLRADTENPKLVEAFDINVPLMIHTGLRLHFGRLCWGAGGAGDPGLASCLMSSNLIVIVFAVVVIGGMDSIMGLIVTGLALGVIEGLTQVFYLEASITVVFIVMAIVLMIRPASLLGKEK